MQSVQEKYKNLQEYLKSLGSVQSLFPAAWFDISACSRQRKHLVRIM